MRSSGASKSDFSHFASPQGVSRFITGDYGLGHTCCLLPDFDKTVAFVRNVLGFGLSDIYNFKPAGDAGPTVRISLLPLRQRSSPQPGAGRIPFSSGCVHVMVEVDNMPEVGRAMDRMQRARSSSLPLWVSTPTTR